jgi:hypothetical protein
MSNVADMKNSKQSPRFQNSSRWNSANILEKKKAHETNIERFLDALAMKRRKKCAFSRTAERIFMFKHVLESRYQFSKLYTVGDE